MWKCYVLIRIVPFSFNFWLRFPRGWSETPKYLFYRCCFCISQPWLIYLLGTLLNWLSIPTKKWSVVIWSLKYQYWVGGQNILDFVLQDPESNFVSPTASLVLSAHLFPSLSSDVSLIWWLLRSLARKFGDFLKMLFAGVTHTVGNEEPIAATFRDLDGDYWAFLYRPLRCHSHTSLRFLEQENRWG